MAFQCITGGSLIYCAMIPVPKLLILISWEKRKLTNSETYIINTVMLNNYVASKFLPNALIGYLYYP